MELKFENLSNGDIAWLMNQVISNLNDEEAYYSDWLIYWPDGESKSECMQDFKEQESFNELTTMFIETCCNYLCESDRYIKLADEGKIYRNESMDYGGGLYLYNITPLDTQIILEFLKWLGFPMKEVKAASDNSVLYVLDKQEYKLQSNKLFLNWYNKLTNK